MPRQSLSGGGKSSSVGGSKKKSANTGKKAEQDQKKAQDQTVAMQKAHDKTMGDLGKGEQNYQKVVEKLRVLSNKMQKFVLTNYWDVGDTFEKLSESPDHYGGHTADELGKEVGLQASSVRHCRTFRKKVDSRQRAAELADEGITWSCVVTMLSLPEKELDAIFDQVLSGKLKREDGSLEKKLLEERKKKEQQRIADGKVQRGGARPANVFKGIFSSCDKMEEQMGNLFEVNTSVKQMEDADPKKDKMISEMGKVRDKLEELKSTIDEALKGLFV
jgi:hypothetical protein